uniref:Nucleolar protein 14 n=1 Tax=Angiostrongylus costaricensis TaxID=334426 RepID=A0A158PL20_ANGCS
MVKKKRQTALGGKKSSSLPKVNPFELKFNRLKHDWNFNVKNSTVLFYVLGKKKGSLGAGHPGLSRKRAYEQRQKSLGVEYDRRGKVNKTNKCACLVLIPYFFHRLLTNVSVKETRVSPTVPNFVMIFFISLKFIDFRLNPNRKDVIADLIAKTRQARENKHSAKDEMETVTEELDAKYLKNLEKIKNSFRPVGATKVAKVDKDDYDKLALSLKLDADARATPAERTKTAEELALDERLQLEELESLRIARMNSEKNKHGHISADVEEVTGKLENREKTSGFEVRFDFHGKLMNVDKVSVKTTYLCLIVLFFLNICEVKVEGVSKQKIFLDSDEELLDEELQDEDEEELDDLIQEINKSDESNVLSKSSSCLRGRQEAIGGEGNASCKDGEEKEYDEEERKNKDGVGTKCSGPPLSKGEMKEFGSSDKFRSVGVLDLEVPFIIEMPRSFEQLVDLLSSYPSEKFEVVLLRVHCIVHNPVYSLTFACFSRLIKCYHPSLAEGNKKLLAKLFLYLLRFFDGSSCGSLTSGSLKMLGSLINVMYVLMKFDVEFSTRCIRALIRQLVAALYPVNDGWHPVCSPALALAAMTLAKSHVINLTVLARQILLVTIISDFVEETKRLVPEAIAFCQGALLMAVENGEQERAPTVVFPISLPHKQMLYVEENLAKDANVDPLTISEVFADEDVLIEECDMKRCQVLRALIAVIQKYRILYSAHEHTFTTTFTPFLVLLKRIPLSRLPSMVAEEIETLIQSMEAECKVRSRVTQMSRVVTEKSMLKMLEPRFEVHFDPERPRMSRDQRRKGVHAEKQKLQYLVKKETRGERRIDEMIRRVNTVSEKMACIREYQQSMDAVNAYTVNGSRRAVLLEELQRENRQILAFHGEHHICLNVHRMSKQPLFKDMTTIFFENVDDDAKEKERFRRLIADISDFMKQCEDSASNNLQQLSQLLQENRILREMLSSAAISTPGVKRAFFNALAELKTEREQKMGNSLVHGADVDVDDTDDELSRTIFEASHAPSL